MSDIRALVSVEVIPALSRNGVNPPGFAKPAESSGPARNKKPHRTTSDGASLRERIEALLLQSEEYTARDRETIEISSNRELPLNEGLEGSSVKLGTADEVESRISSGTQCS